MFVWTIGVGGFFIFVAVAIGFAMTVAMVGLLDAEAVDRSLRAGMSIVKRREPPGKVLGRDATMLSKRAS